MMQFARVGDFCPNESCPDYGKLRSDQQRNIKKVGKTKQGRQRYQCKTCKRTFFQIQLAHLLARRGRDGEAEVLLQDVARSADAERCGEAFSALGDLYVARGRWSEALTAYRAAAEAVPTKADYWRRLARLYEQLGLYDEADQIYERLSRSP